MPENDEGKKSYDAILKEEIEEGLTQLERPASGLLLSGLSAGLDLGFSVFLMAVALSTLGETFSEATMHVIVANLYAVGFVFVIIGRSELFTEHTTLAAFPVLGGRTSLAWLARLWGLVYVGNLAGAVIFSLILAGVGPSLATIDAAALGTIARTMTEHSTRVVFASAVLAGWLMGLLSWLVVAARETASQILVVWVVTATIGFGELHHSIVGTVEVLSGVMAGQGVTVGDFLHFLVWTTLGNAVGGVIFVALVKYGHAVQRRF